MILFLDDDPERTRRFRRQVPSATCCETAAAMIAALSRVQGTIGWLFLDHDLGGEVYMDSRLPNTGMEVVRWLEQNRKAIGTVVVHSHNPEAAQAMSERLVAAGYHAVQVPFLRLRLDRLSDKILRNAGAVLSDIRLRLLGFGGA